MASPLFDGVSQIRAEAGALVLMKLEGKAGLWDADFRLKPGCSTPLFNWPCAVLESSTSSMSSSTSESSTKRDWRAGWADCHFDGRCHFEGRCRFDFDSSDSSPPLRLLPVCIRVLAAPRGLQPLPPKWCLHGFSHRKAERRSRSASEGKGVVDLCSYGTP